MSEQKPMEYKYLYNGEWEHGKNRVLNFDDPGLYKGRDLTG
jgi:hypothetical protein